MYLEPLVYKFGMLSITKLQNLKPIHNGSPGRETPHMLLSITKLQNLKAIHNASFTVFWCNKDVINHKTIKFESNSQRYLYCYT